MTPPEMVARLSGRTANAMARYDSGRAKSAGLAVVSSIARICGKLLPRIVSLLLIMLMGSGGASAYSVLTHEEIVDLLWKDEIKPLILKRYPGLTEAQITEAHA